MRESDRFEPAVRAAYDAWASEMPTGVDARAIVHATHPAIRERLDGRRPGLGWRSRRFGQTVGWARLAAGAAVAALVLATVVGANLIAQRGNIGGPAPSLSPSPILSPSPTFSPAPSPITLGPGIRRLSAGTYRLDLQALGDQAAGFPTLLITVPDGWNSLDGSIINRPEPGRLIPPVSVAFWDVDLVYRHPCQWQGTLFQPGLEVDELARALADQPLRNATQPVDVRLNGYAGKYLEWSVPEEMDFAECDVAEGVGAFFSWDGRYQQGPGQLDRLWILDIDGARLVIDAFEMPYATDELREELQAVVDSITFERVDGQISAPTPTN